MNDEQRPAGNGQRRPEDWRVWLGWVLASTVGWAVGGPAGVAAGGSGDIIVAGYIGVTAGGILAGMLQWLVLRRHVAGAGWWMAASAAGWVAAGPGVGLVAAVMGAALTANAGWAALGIMYGAVTGCALVWLLRQPRPAAATG